MIFGRNQLCRPCRAVIDTVRPVIRDSVEVRTDRIEIQHYLGYDVLYFRVVGHRPADCNRSLVLHGQHSKVDRALRDAAVDVGETHIAPGKDAENERIVSIDRYNPRDVLVGYEGAVQYHVVAARGAHPQSVPGLYDAAAAF